MANTITGKEGPEILNGTEGDDNIFGLGGGDILNGGDGNDYIDGGAGWDELHGGAGNDILRTDGTDYVLDGGEGYDIVEFRYAPPWGQLFVLDANNLSGSKINAEEFRIAGTSLADRLYASNPASFSSSLVFDGGAGNDNLSGASGKDTLVGGIGDDMLGGLGGDDLLYGDNGADTLDGGDGRDLLDGGSGNDTLNGGAGIDVLKAGSGDDAIVGGADDDQLYGGAGNDLINGGSGADRMYGGDGDDTYVIDDIGDVVNEEHATGVDLVKCSRSFSLAAGVSVLGDVENLTLTGTDSIDGTGNDLGNVIAGNSAANKLNGAAGNDILTGGIGKDIFVFDTALNARTNLDVITDFNARDDTIRLENSVFTSLKKTGALAKGFFVENATGKAADKDDHIIYNTKTGALMYDADGSGKGAAIQFATLQKGLHLTNLDFVVV